MSSGNDFFVDEKFNIKHDKKAYLSGNLEMLGGNFHIEAIEVFRNEGDVNEAVIGYYNSRIVAIENEYCVNFETVKWGGREYVVLITPFSR